MQPTTGNTLAPGYNAINPTEANKGEFDLGRFAEYQPESESRAQVTPAELQQLRDQEPASIDQLEAIAQQRATPTMHVAIGQESAVPARPVREAGIDTDERLARTEIKNAGPAVVAIRRQALADANPEQRAQAQLS